MSPFPYTKNQINEAGKLLSKSKAINPNSFAVATDRYAMEKVESWRSSHVHPTRIFSNLVHERAQQLDRSALVYRRLKRMASIISKLQRSSKMQLTTMQDIGGCRAVLESLEQVTSLCGYCREIAGPPVSDYITEPKEDGYRSIHFVARYEAPLSVLQYLPEFQYLNGRRVEIQIRTRLQHAWATAVETVDLFTNQTLKVGGGNPQWKRFFALVSSVFAAHEACPVVPGTPATVVGATEELRSLWFDLEVLDRLSAWTHTLKHAEETHIADVYLLELDTQGQTIKVTGWPVNEVDEATAEYERVERLTAGEPNRSAVLASAESLAALREAFPSYYGDTNLFMMHVKAILGDSRRRDVLTRI